MYISYNIYFVCKYYRIETHHEMRIAESDVMYTVLVLCYLFTYLRLSIDSH